MVIEGVQILDTVYGTTCSFKLSDPHKFKEVKLDNFSSKITASYAHVYLSFITTEEMDMCTKTIIVDQRLTACVINE